MIRPPIGCCAFIIATAWCAHRYEPVRLVATIDRQPSGVTSSTAPAGAPVPALLTSRSSRPKRSPVAANSAATEPSSATSACTGRTISGSACCTVSSSSSKRRPAATTYHPRSASAIVIRRPSPEPAPVTTATFSVVMTITVRPAIPPPSVDCHGGRGWDQGPFELKISNLLAGEGGLSLLKEGGDALVEVPRAAELALDLGLELEVLGHPGVEPVVELALGARVGPGGAVAEPLEQVVGPGGELVVRPARVDQADVDRLGRGDGIAEQRHLGRPGEADAGRDEQRRAAVGD